MATPSRVEAREKAAPGPSSGVRRAAVETGGPAQAGHEQRSSGGQQGVDAPGRGAGNLAPRERLLVRHHEPAAEDAPHQPPSEERKCGHVRRSRGQRGGTRRGELPARVVAAEEAGVRVREEHALGDEETENGRGQAFGVSAPGRVEAAHERPRRGGRGPEGIAVDDARGHVFALGDGSERLVRRAAHQPGGGRGEDPTGHDPHRLDPRILGGDAVEGRRPHAAEPLFASRDHAPRDRDERAHGMLVEPLEDRRAPGGAIESLARSHEQLAAFRLSEIADVQDTVARARLFPHGAGAAEEPARLERHDGTAAPGVEGRGTQRGEAGREVLASRTHAGAAGREELPRA